MMPKYFKLILFALLLFLIGILSCQKNATNSIEEPNNHLFNLTGEVYGKDVVITWNATNFDDFVSYRIVRSKNPLPKTYQPDLALGVVIDNQAINSYVDNEDVLIAEWLYYTLFVEREKGFEKSEEIYIQTNLKKISVYIGNQAQFLFNPTNRLLYILSGFPHEETLKVFDTQSYEILAEDTIGVAYNVALTYGQSGGNDELYINFSEIISNKGYEIRDGRTLEVKTTIEEEDIESGKLAFDKDLLCFKNGNWNILQANNGNSLFKFFGHEGEAHVFPIDTEEERVQFVSIGENRLETLKVDLAGNIKGFTNEPAQSLPATGYAISPNRKYFFGYEDGSYFDNSLIALGQLDNENGQHKFIDFAFSPDGKHIFTIRDDMPKQLKKYAFPSLNLEQEYTFSYPLRRIFTDEERLVILGFNDINNSILQVINLDEID